MKTVRLTMAQALVAGSVAQRTVVDGQDAPLFPGVFAIFGHGNVTCLGEALEAVKDELPTWRGQNEQSMALAAVAFAKAKPRRQIMVAASSIGPGATNMVTAAGVAHSNRLPVLLLSGDTFANRAARSRAPAGRAFQQSQHHRERCLPRGDPLLGPHRQAGAADRRLAAAGGRGAARPGRVRAGLPRPAPGRAGRGLRLSRAILRAARAPGAAAARPTSSSWSPRPACCARPSSRC